MTGSPELPEGQRKAIEARFPDWWPPITHSRLTNASFAARGLSAPTLDELAPADAGVYREQMLELTRKNPYAVSVRVYGEAEYRQMRLLVTDDGKAGVAIKDDEIVSAFAH